MLIRTASAGNSLPQASLHPRVEDLFRRMSFNSDVEPSSRQSVESQTRKRVPNGSYPQDLIQLDSDDIFRRVLRVLWISVMQPVIDSLNLEVC